MTSRCCHCNGTDDLIVGDSPLPVCRSCVALLTTCADKPWECSDELLETMWEQHSGSVNLVRTANEPYEFVWEWIA